jgi:hypothetical protein
MTSANGFFDWREIDRFLHRREIEYRKPHRHHHQRRHADRIGHRADMFERYRRTPTRVGGRLLDHFLDPLRAQLRSCGSAVPRSLPQADRPLRIAVDQYCIAARGDWHGRQGAPSAYSCRIRPCARRRQ